MKYTVLKSVQAARDIEEAFVYIAEDDLDRAVYFLVAVEETVEMIAVIRLSEAFASFKTLN